MILPVTLRPEPEQDLADARDWYEARLAGLGDDFLLATAEFFQRIIAFPEIYSIVVKNVRRGKLRRCPSSGPSGHLLPVRTGRREGGENAGRPLLPATCGEKVPR